MANEATPVIGPYEIQDFTVANGSTGTDVEQFTVMQLTSPKTVSASAGANLFGGILATEKVGGNGKTRIGCYVKGTFLLTNSGDAIADGAMVSLSGANLIKTAVAAELLTGAAFGKAMQDIAASATGEVRIGALG